MNKNKEHYQKMIPRRDFLYLCIILGVILIAIVSIVLGDSTRAGENLNFAATTVSIVLAVIAIIYTFVDSSSQRNNMIHLRETADKMERALEDAKSLFEESGTQLNAVSELKDELFDKLVETEQWRKLVLEKINSLTPMQAHQDKVDMDDLKEVVDLLNEAEYQFEEKEKKSQQYPTDYNVGDKVMHAKWGVGEVKLVKGRGRGTEITVYFPIPVGFKKLLAAFAPLKKLL
jgi:predicted metal-dependent hydrolase